MVPDLTGISTDMSPILKFPLFALIALCLFARIAMRAVWTSRLGRGPASRLLRCAKSYRISARRSSK
jgi:hypothetical protein